MRVQGVAYTRGLRQGTRPTLKERLKDNNLPGRSSRRKEACSTGETPCPRPSFCLVYGLGFRVQGLGLRIDCAAPFREMMRRPCFEILGLRVGGFRVGIQGRVPYDDETALAVTDEAGL